VDFFFTILAVVPPVVLIFCLLFRFIPSRLNLSDDSWSFRWALAYVSVYLLLFLVVNIIYDVLNLSNNFSKRGNDGNSSSTLDDRRIYIALALSISSFIWNLLFPAFLLPSLRADTQFWRGISNTRGLYSDKEQEFSESISENKNPVDMALASRQLPHMMKTIGQHTIDFTLLKKGRFLARGASAKVYEGKFRNEKVAIKVYSPTELTDEVIDAFKKETEIMCKFQHPNVIKFYGICVKPPDVALVIEFCGRGDLKANLEKEPSYWNNARKLRACIDCARGLAYLHGQDIIHRDVKTNNFFVDENHTIKIGDFGEASKKAVDKQTMTIVGTVNYMSPELIEGRKTYTSAIDIYAFGISLAAIWSGEEPFSNVKNTFQIYDMVRSGERPIIPVKSPEGISGIIQVCFVMCIESVYKHVLEHISVLFFNCIRMLGNRIQMIDLQQ